MVFGRKSSVVLFILLYLFSSWLMYKSIRYDKQKENFLIARNQVGDFGLHLSLIRSFSQGGNFPAQSPFFPGPPLVYHYGFDFVVGLLARCGVPLVDAWNMLSAFCFATLLYGIFCLTCLLFRTTWRVGMMSLLVSMLHSDFSFIGYIQHVVLSQNIIKSLWYLPDYLYKGPFDGSEYSILFTLNTYLNQRHLITGLAISVWAWYMLIYFMQRRRALPFSIILFIGFIVGVSVSVHTLVGLSSIVLLSLFLIANGYYKRALQFISIVIVTTSPYVHLLSSQPIHNVLQYAPGFFASSPLTLFSFLRYWAMNTGISCIFLSIALWYGTKFQRLFFACVGLLFIIGNIFQVSYRLEHNQSLFNYFFIFSSSYVAFGVSQLLKVSRLKFIGVISLGILFVSGVFTLLIVKNDFHYPVADTRGNSFMQWISTSTDKRAIFLTKSDMYDSVTLSGRYSFLGPDYYLTVMGYNPEYRKRQVVSFYESNTPSSLREMQRQGIQYVVIPKKSTSDFPYHILYSFWKSNTKKVFEDASVTVYHL